MLVNWVDIGCNSMSCIIDETVNNSVVRNEVAIMIVSLL